MKYKHILIFLIFLFSISSNAQLDGVKICIDPGHGGHDAANDRRIELPNGLIFWESEGNLMTAYHEKELLESLGASVKMTRTENDDSDDISLSSRVAIANAFGADFFQSNHTNAGTSGVNYSLMLFKGTDNNPLWPDAKEMGAIASPNLQNLLRTTKNYNRGDYSFLGFNLGVLKNTNMPATLSEGSFHDLPLEGLRLKNTAYSQNYAWALTKSFCAYFNVDGFSTGRVGGIVIDRNTDDVINNLTVICNPGNKTYIGDDFYNGFYAIGGLDPGTYTLTFSRSGYFDMTETVTIEANKYIDLDLSLPLNNNGAPYVDFEIDGLPAGVGDELIFDASKCADDGMITKYEWSINDTIDIDTGKIIKHTFDADGDYTIKLTITDDELKTSTLSKTIQIKTTPPDIPVLLSVESFNDYKGATIKWKKSIQTSLKGYRLYYSTDLEKENIYLLADTNQLKPDMVEFTIDSISDSYIYNFWMTAVNIANFESEPSDVYGIMNYPFDENKKVLIVDGFKRRSSYPDPSHDFAASKYLQGLKDALGHVDVTTCLNEPVITGSIKLSDYEIVIWFLGDESTIDETFSSYEQNKVKDYLNAGGKLFVTGSEIGWDLDSKGSSVDKVFYHDYLKSNFISDGATGRAPARGISDSDFEGVTLHYGEVYVEDYPDVIEATGGAFNILNYNEGSISGIAYKGVFGSATTPGALVHVAFPIETVGNKWELKLFFERLLLFFDTTVGLSELSGNNFELNIDVYPTLVNNQIYLKSNLGNHNKFKVEVFDISGNKVKTTQLELMQNEIKNIQLSDLQKGVYILTIANDNGKRNYKFVKQ